MSWQRSLFFLMIVIFSCLSKRLSADSHSTIVLDSNEMYSVENVLDTALIKDFSKLNQFHYNKNLFKQSDFSRWWDAIVDNVLQKIATIFDSLFGIKVSKTTSALVFWGFVFLILLFALFLLLKTKSQMLTTSGGSVSEVSSIEFENILYLQKIEQARKNEDYKQGIRYVLLHTLQQLAEKDLIKLVPGKTLIEYQYDIKNHELKRLFVDICYIYEYIWFGNFNSSKSLMDEMCEKMELLLTPKNFKR